MKLYDANPQGAAHIRETVPLEVQALMLRIAEAMKEQYINDLTGECVRDCEEIEPINGLGYSGFTPFQCGGYALTALYRNDNDASYHFNKGQTVHNAALYEQRCKDIAEEVGLSEDWNYNELSEEQQREVDTIESTYDPDSAFVTFRIYVTEEDKVRITLSINFIDTEYGREKYEDLLTEKEINFCTFTRKKGRYLARFNKWLKQHNASVTI